MTQGAGGMVLDEPSPEEGREGSEVPRPNRRSRRARTSVERESEGTRQARRVRAERRRFWFVFMPTVVLLLGLTAAIGAVIRASSDESSAEPTTANVPAGARGPQTLLLGHRGPDGRIDLLVLFGSNRSRASVLMLPVSTQVEVPSLGPQALADLPSQGDQGLLQTTVENLLGVHVADTLVLDDAGLNAVLAKAAPIDVDLNRAVQFDGSEEIVAAGQHQIAAPEAARLLVANQAGSELDRLVTVQDVLDGWMRRLRRAPTAEATVTTQPALAALVAAAKASDRRTDTLPVETVTSGEERFEPRMAEVRRYVVGAFPNALLAAGGRRPRVEILNGTGAVGLAQTIASRIVPAGGQVTLTGNLSKFGLPKTQVVYYRDGDRAAAQHLLEALGCGSLQKADTAIGVVDVTILAGADCFRTGPPAP